MKPDQIKSQAMIDLENAVKAVDDAEQKLKQSKIDLDKAVVAGLVDANPPAWYNTLNSPLISDAINNIFPNIGWQQQIRQLALLAGYRYYVINHQIYTVENNGQPTGIWVKNYGFTRTPQ